MIAFIFPGQGAQTIGMGRDFYDKYPEAREVFEQADDRLGFSLTSLIFEGDEAELLKTENTQPALLTVSTAIARCLQKSIKPGCTAGLSIGEYAAHVLAGTISFADAVTVVHKRGRFMQEAVPLGVGGMAAILGLSDSDVEEVCASVSDKGIVEPANFNCPGQIVISGENGAVLAACEAAKQKGAKRAIPLSVSAPFHCSMMKGAGERLRDVLSGIEFGDFTIPLFTNVTAEKIKSRDDIAGLLVTQVASPVRFEQSIRNMIASGVDTFIEVGPGKALAGFVKKIDDTVKVFSVYDINSMEEVLNGGI